jgi:tetratricopeptide (TPR) repeat protein
MAAKDVMINSGIAPIPKRAAMLMMEAGYFFMDLRRFDDARDVFGGIAALLPKSEAPLIGLGILDSALGNHEKALQHYRKAAGLAPKSAIPRAYCGEALLFMGKANEAVKELKAAVDLEPGSTGAAHAQALIAAKEQGILPPPQTKK